MSHELSHTAEEQREDLKCLNAIDSFAMDSFAMDSELLRIRNCYGTCYGFGIAWIWMDSDPRPEFGPILNEF